jgi:hypothetical protein
VDSPRLRYVSFQCSRGEWRRYKIFFHTSSLIAWSWLGGQKGTVDYISSSSVAGSYLPDIEYNRSRLHREWQDVIVIASICQYGAILECSSYGLGQPTFLIYTREYLVASALNCPIYILSSR